MGDIRHHLVKTVLTSLNFSGMDRLFAALDSARGVILTLHHVKDDPVPEFAPNAHLTVSTAFLEKTVQMLRARNIDIVSMDEAHKRIAGSSEKRFASFTFDDGYRDNADNAAPIMQRYEAPYIIYIATGLIEGGADLWWEGLELLVRQQDRVILKTGDGSLSLDCLTTERKCASFCRLVDHFSAKVPEKEVRQKVRELCWMHKIDLDAHREAEMMTWHEIREISSDPLCTLGAHTVHHHALSRLERDGARREIEEGVRRLEAETGSRPRHFAYPYGSAIAAGKREFDLVEELGFDTAVTTRRGLVYRQHANHQMALPRISMNGHFQHQRLISPLLSGLPTRIARGFKKLDVA